jgi:hypothetical protein
VLHLGHLIRLLHLTFLHLRIRDFGNIHRIVVEELAISSKGVCLVSMIKKYMMLTSNKRNTQLEVLRVSNVSITVERECWYFRYPRLQEL